MPVEEILHFRLRHKVEVEGRKGLELRAVIQPSIITNVNFLCRHVSLVHFCEDFELLEVMGSIL